ncbi:hypothetical protein Tco_1176069 [Tanacetum coccineum]
MLSITPDSELVSLEEVKDFHTEDGEIEDDILSEKLSKINLLIAKIEAINSNPLPSSDFVTKSPSTFLNFFLKETNTFDNSIPKSETFCFDLEENNSGSTTTRSDYSLPNYEAFYLDDDHIKEKSSGMIDTLLPFLSENEDKVVNTGILATGEEQSPHLLSHRGLKALNESSMMIHGEKDPNLGVRHLHFYPP